MKNVIGMWTDPYPGLASFQDKREDHLLFFGRDNEKQTLLDMILSEHLVLLFSRSGLGKTSLINAGLLEELRIRGFFPVVIRLTHDSERGPMDSVRECVRKEAARCQLTVGGVPNNNSLWEYFQGLTFTKEDRTLRPLLIMDQFEELFTVIRPQKRWEESFVTDFANLARRRVPREIRDAESAKLDSSALDDSERQRIVSLLYEGNCPEVKILISIREDFLAELESLRRQIPTIFQNSYRLEPLTIEQARQAIELPSQQAEVLGENTFTFGPGVVDEIIDFLRMEKFAGNTVEGLRIDPVQLQILCQHLSRERLKKNAAQITIADLKGRGGMKRAIVGYYHKVLGRFPRLRLGWNSRKYRPSPYNLLLLNRPRSAIRKLCEHRLITPTGHRNSQSIDVINRDTGVTDGDLSQLVDERLLRAERRFGIYCFELTHDTLIQPLIVSRRKKRVFRAVTLSLLILSWLYLPPLIFDAYRHIESYRLQRKLSDLKERLSNETCTDSDRLSALQEILDAHSRDLSQCNLQPLDLHSFKLASLRFDNANLREATLNNADLNSCSFSGADLSFAKLMSANLIGANLSGATLSRATLSGAHMRDADLSNAILRDASLTGAELDRANFEGVKIDGIDFGGTAWWVAYGWTRDQILKLKKTSPPKAFAGTNAYRAGLANVERIPLNPAFTATVKSDLLNSRAWYRAICGAELKDALKQANESVTYAPSSDRALDTRGYILLQLGRYDEALSDLSASLTLRLRNGTETSRLGLAHYHLALALDYKGNRDEAQSHYDSARNQGFRPSHECVLTPPLDWKNCEWPAAQN